MAPLNTKAPIGIVPIDAHTTYGIQSKAVNKYTDFFTLIFSYNSEILFCGWEGVVL